MIFFTPRGKKISWAIYNTQLSHAMLFSHQIIIICVILLLLAVVVALLLRWRKAAPGQFIIGGARSRKHKRTPAASKRGYSIKDIAKYPRSKSEAEVIKHLEDITGKKFPTVYPDWLVWKGKRLELDGYNDELKIAIEFSGPLHTKWSPNTEPYDKYFGRIVRDTVKRRLCKRHGVHLIIIDMTLPRHHWRNYLLSRLYDISLQQAGTGHVRDKPSGYIPAQKAKPFRNPQLELEMGLDAEMRAAKKL